MSRENLEIVRHVYEAFGRRDWAETFRDAHPEVEVTLKRFAPGTHRGRERITKLIEDFADAFDTMTWEPAEFFERDDLVVALVTVRARPRASSDELVTHNGHLWTVRDGVIVSMEGFPDPAEALDAAGLSQQPAGPGAEVVRRLIEVVNSGKSIDEAMALLEDLLHPEIEYVNPAEAIEGGTRRGLAGVRAAVENFIEGAGRAARVEVEQTHERGERVLMRFRIQARGATSGAEAVSPPLASLFTIRDRRIARIEWHFWTDEILEDFQRGQALR
jgi:ketosteroid isomerase-like protein